MPDGFTFAADDKAGGATPSGKSAFSWEADDPTHSQALARVAQPTEFEKSAAASGASATPWTDTARGVGQGLMGTAALAGRAIHAIPGVGPALIPSQGLAAEEKMSIPHTPGEKLGSNIEGVAEAALPIGEVADAVKGSKYVRPAAQFLAENVIPEIKSLPYVGRGIEAAEKAPTLVKAAIRGGTTGATLGALEQAVRTRDLGETAKGALYGGAGGAILGMGAHGINRLAGAGASAEIPAVSKEPFELTPPPQPTEPAIQQKMEFPTANEIAFRTDANGTRWAKLPNSPAEVSIPKNLSGNDAQKYAQEKLELQSNFAKSRSPMGQLDELMKQQGGAPEGGIPALQPNVPLREQRQLQKPFGNRAAVEVSEMHGPRTTAPEQIPQAIPNAVDQAMGGDLTPEAIEKARLQEKYPDAGDRQAIHRTSEKTFEATRDNPELRKALGDLKAHDNQGGPDLARAAANLGEDLGERRIGNKKAEWMGAGQIGRGEMFDRLLDKGYTPQQILDAAQAEPASIPTLAKPGPMRTSGRKQVREKTGD